jgi:hypothetical protein
MASCCGAAITHDIFDISGIILFLLWANFLSVRWLMNRGTAAKNENCTPQREKLSLVPSKFFIWSKEILLQASESTATAVFDFVGTGLILLSLEAMGKLYF